MGPPPHSRRGSTPGKPPVALGTPLLVEPRRGSLVRPASARGARTPPATTAQPRLPASRTRADDTADVETFSRPLAGHFHKDAPGFSTARFGRGLIAETSREGC